MAAPKKGADILPLSPPPICALNCDVSIFEIGGMSGWREGEAWLATSDDYYNHYKLPSADNELNNSHKGAAEYEAETSSTFPSTSSSLPPSASTAANTLNLNHEPQRPQCIASRLK